MLNTSFWIFITVLSSGELFSENEFSINFTMWLPTTAESAISEISEICFFVAIPNPTATGRSENSFMSDNELFISFIGAFFVPVVPVIVT